MAKSYVVHIFFKVHPPHLSAPDGMSRSEVTKYPFTFLKFLQGILQQWNIVKLEAGNFARINAKYKGTVDVTSRDGKYRIAGPIHNEPHQSFAWKKDRKTTISSSLLLSNV